MTTHNRFQQAAEAVQRLCTIMAQLRAEGGCPWDREQTLASLKPYLVEEAYEVLDAITADDPKEHCTELGDLLLQIVFQAEIRQESQTFGMADVANAISDKLIRRHPHVFGDASADSAAGALRNWEAIKAKERPIDSSCLDGIPRAMPGLLRALRTGEKAAAVGFDWGRAEDAFAKVDEEVAELRAEIMALPSDPSDGALAQQHRQQQQARIKEELGDVLFSLVNIARHLEIDPEDALRHTIDKFHRRFRYIEHQLASEGRRPQDATLDEMEHLWTAAKQST